MLFFFSMKDHNSMIREEKMISYLQLSSRKRFLELSVEVRAIHEANKKNKMRAQFQKDG